MWPPVIFLSLVALVLADFWWHERRLRRQRVAAEREFGARSLEQQKQAIAQARAQQEALFDSMIEGVLVLDPERRVEMFNASLARLLDLPPAVRGQPVSHALRWPALADLVERAATGKQGISADLEFTDGSRRLFQVNAAVCRAVGGGPRGLVLVFHEITRLKELERTRQEFVANVSHELRTPLSLIQGFVETLQDGAKTDPALTDRFLGIIAKHTDRLAFLIDDLLTISRLESGHEALRREPLAVRDVAARVVEDLQARATDKDMTLENLVPESLTVRADAERLQQVLFNLVENAIKYGRTQGRVRLEGQTDAEGAVELRVSDDGPGIPAASLPRIFERFYRVDKARSRETGGTGLGLAIVKHIVQAHEGKVWVESAPGRGSTFFVALPKG